MKNEIQNNQTTEIMDFPYGWNKGDTCVLIYFGVRSHTGLYHRVSPWRMFRTREDAVESLTSQRYGGMSLQ